MSLATLPDAKSAGPRSGGVPVLDTEALRIGLIEGQSGRLVIAFTGLGKGYGAVPAEEFAGSARGDDNSVVFVADKKGLWYQEAATETAILREVRAIIARLRPREILTVGNSMGAFGAIRFAAPLGAQAALAFGPQFSVKPGVVKGETRFGGASRRIPGFRVESLAESFDPGVTYYVIHGIKDNDRLQAAAFPETPALHHFLYEEADHGSARVLKRAGALGPLFDAALGGRVEEACRIIEDSGGVPRAEVPLDTAPESGWTDARFVEIGWWLFVACALFFTWGALRAGDMIGLMGSLTFLAANIAFMIPIYRKRSGSNDG